MFQRGGSVAANELAGPHTHTHTHIHTHTHTPTRTIQDGPLGGPFKLTGAQEGLESFHLMRSRIGA